MRIQSLFQNYDNLFHFGERVVDFILPPLCPATGEIVDTLGMVDSKYWQSLNFIHAPCCKICGTPFAFEIQTDMACGTCLETPPTYNTHRSALVYDDASKSLILRFKHGDQTHAVKAFIPWLRQAGRELITQADIIMPVPLHKNRLIKRRYNQANLIGRELIKHYPDKTYLADGLLRKKQTESQGHKKADDRRRNVAGAFAVSPIHKDIIEGKNILLLDDVYTTGATVNECAKTLLKAETQSVNILTLARVVKN